MFCIELLQLLELNKDIDGHIEFLGETFFVFYFCTRMEDEIWKYLQFMLYWNDVDSLFNLSYMMSIYIEMSIQ